MHSSPPPVPVPLKRLPHGEGLPLPAYATSGAAGMDVVSAEDVTLAPGARHSWRRSRTTVSCRIPGSPFAKRWMFVYVPSGAWHIGFVWKSGDLHSQSGVLALHALNVGRG